MLEFPLHLTYPRLTFPYLDGGAFNKIILYDVPVNSHFAGVWFSEFLSGDDLEETEQLAVGEVGEEVVHLHLGLQQAIL